VLLSPSMYRIGPKSEIQNSVLREIGHVVDDAVRLIAVVPVIAVIPPFSTPPRTSFCQKPRSTHRLQDARAGECRTPRAIRENCSVACLLGCTKQLEVRSQFREPFRHCRHCALPG